MNLYNFSFTYIFSSIIQHYVVLGSHKHGIVRKDQCSKDYDHTHIIVLMCYILSDFS
jgi:hypothetical protein